MLWRQRAMTTAGALLALVGATPTTVASGAASVSHVSHVRRVVKVVGLGDSVPAASGCRCTSFVVLLAHRLSNRTNGLAVPRNLGRPGLTSAGLVAQVLAGGLRAAPGTVTTITIGANDFDEAKLSTTGCRAADAFLCYRPQLVALSHNLSRLLQLMQPTAVHGRVVLTGYWNVFLAGPRARAKGAAYVADSDALTKAVNRIIAAAARAAGDGYVDIYTPFLSDADEDRLLADDGDHPSQAGHLVIATALAHAVKR